MCTVCFGGSERQRAESVFESVEELDVHIKTAHPEHLTKGRRKKPKKHNPRQGSGGAVRAAPLP